MPDFARLKSQNVREHWKHEAKDFTPWLANEIRAEHISSVEDALGLDLNVIQEEKSVGRYSVDILAEVVDDNRRVVIENQLEPINAIPTHGLLLLDYVKIKSKCILY